MTRSFYTDLLAAMWMAQQFGMRFDNGGTEPLDSPGDLDLAAHMGSKRFVIHPDSLPLLEPMVGDLVTNHRAACRNREVAGLVFKVTPGLAWINCPTRENGKDYFAENRDLVRVVQRDGKPFHWPEGEPE